jgi:xylose dehydrogenase (NAD/NADP)
MTSLKWGVLSTARITDKLQEQTNGEMNWFAVASRNKGRAQKHAKSHGYERAYGSYEELLADPDVDAIYNPLPNGMHLPWSIKAIEAGKHVLCEKPLTWSPIAAQRAFDIAEREGRILAEAFMWRHHPQVAKARELITGGKIGDLHQLRASHTFHLTDPGDVRLQEYLEGGSLQDLGCYCVSAVRTLSGAEPERVYGEAEMTDGGVDLTFSGTLRMPGDVLAVIDCSFAGGPRTERVEAVGNLGTVVLNDPWHAVKPVVELITESGTEEFDCGQPYSNYLLEMQNFEAAVAGAAEPLLGRDDALAQATTIEALYASAEKKEPVWLKD